MYTWERYALCILFRKAESKRPHIRQRHKCYLSNGVFSWQAEPAVIPSTNTFVCVNKEAHGRSYL